MICLSCSNIVVVLSLLIIPRTIYHIGTNQTEVYQDMNSDLETLSDWFKANKLSVNASKTKYMVFKCKMSAEAQTTQPDLYIDNEVLEKVPVTKFLDVYIDENHKPVTIGDCTIDSLRLGLRSTGVGRSG